ncbi:MAG: flagellar basal body L-ring protein FlgH [Planctomycetota bacterium]
MKPSQLPFVSPASIAFVVLLAGGATAQARRGSIYDLSHGSVSPVASKLAAKVGDLVTVVISETQDLKNEESSDISKSTALDYQIRNLDIAPNAFNPLPRLSTSSEDAFNGAANYTKKGKFTARLTAVVVDVLPNGNLVIGGRREIRIDKETKLLEFCGIVRGFDIKADNSVASEMVANARVSYEGRGPLTNGTNRRGVGGWVHDALDWLWPF